MSRADIAIKETGGRNAVPTDRWVVAAGGTLLVKAGEPAKLSAALAKNQVILLEDADLTIATDQPMSGIAAEDSTETASASGYSDQYVPLPDVKWEIKAKTAASVDTQSEIDALFGYLYLIDLTSSVFTIDTAVSASTAAFLIVGGDANRSTVHFRIRPDACAFGRAMV
jgi:hypothetical protein